jgi:CelD/BcsL family acetyltransferase involved in cellulose biosynthesis
MLRSNLRLVLHKEIPEDADLPRQWNTLLNVLERPQVFYTYEWSLAVQRAYHASLCPLLFLAYDSQNSLCGIASLVRKREGGEVSFLCATTGDYCDFLCAQEYKHAFVAAVLADLRAQGIQDITLTNLPADSGTLEAIRDAGAQSGYHCFSRTAYMCAQVSLETIERRPGGNSPVLPRKKMVRRFLNAMGREAPVRLDHARSWDNIQPLLPEFVQSHVARFLMTGRISNMVRRERRIFLSELARLLAESGWITLTRLAAGSKGYAWNYGFQFRDTWFWYQPTFDSDIEKYSPGFCLLAKIIEEAATSPEWKVVDLGLGAEEYKDRFTNQSRKTLYVTLRTSKAQHAREIVRYSASRIVMASPTCEKVLRAAAAHVQQLNTEKKRKGLSAITTRIPKRLWESLWSEEEVFFYEWCGSVPLASSIRMLKTLDANQLAIAAMQYEDDTETLTYLIRSAARLRTRDAEGFVLVDTQGHVLHLAWVKAFDGFFLSELNAKVDAPSADAVMLFDCWTPLARRGHGYYAGSVALIAERVRKDGKAPWIFSATRNASSVRGLEKSGFRRRYSLIRQHALLWQRIKGKTPRLVQAPGGEVSARV